MTTECSSPLFFREVGRALVCEFSLIPRYLHFRKEGDGRGGSGKWFPDNYFCPVTLWNARCVPIRGHSSFSAFSSTPKTMHYFCTVPSGSHWPQVAIKHLKWGQCKVRGAVGIKYFKDLYERKNVNFPSRLRSTSW